MYKPEDIITGEKFQELADVSISMLEHKEFESKNVEWLDINTYDYGFFKNPSLIYLNSSLINRTKPKLIACKLDKKMTYWRNKFSLILHNSDQDFSPHHIRLLRNPYLEKIYTQNCNVSHEKVIPLPIGIANSRWKHGDLKTLCDVANKKVKKTKNIYYNFTVEGGMRPEYRVECKKVADNLKLELNKNLPYKKYLQDLQKHKYCLCPSGNGLDTHRLWECLYLGVIPITIESTFIKNFSDDFPIYLLKKWSDLDLELLEKEYKEFTSLDYPLLKFKNYCSKVKLL